MSSDRRPARVRVVSSGRTSVLGDTDATPARRRSDSPSAHVNEPQVLGALAAERADPRDGASLLWIAGALVLFLVGCAIGGALFVMAGLAGAGSL
jgi:hypothetical protein